MKIFAILANVDLNLRLEICKLAGRKAQAGTKRRQCNKQFNRQFNRQLNKTNVLTNGLQMVKHVLHMGPSGLGPIKQKVVDHHHPDRDHHHHHHHGHDHDHDAPGPEAKAGTQQNNAAGPARGNVFFWVPAFAPGPGRS